jgi:hypothetical protein
MRNLILGLGTVVFLSLAGCGGTSTFSCDRMVSGSRVCIDYDQVSGDISVAEEQCRAASGTLGMKCSTAGAVGGCRLVAPQGETGTVTTWYFSGTAATVMTSCGSSTTFVAP